MIKSERLLEEFRRQRRAGDPRLTVEDNAVLLRITTCDLARRVRRLPGALSAADPLLGGGPDLDG